MQIADFQEASIRSRKTLAESTRSFKKGFSESAGSGSNIKAPFMGLLKEYQAEVDRLTARAKFAEGAFLEIYKALDIVPDPTPLLIRGEDDSALVREYEERLLGMQAENSALEIKAEDQTMYEDTIAHLQEELHAATLNVDARVSAPACLHRK